MRAEDANPRLPVCTAVFVGLAVCVSAGPPALVDLLELRRAAVLEGELWRGISGHLVHGHLSLAVWDLGAIALLGSWVESRSRRELVLSLGLGALLSAMAVLALRPDLSLYQGSSALGTALLVCQGLRLSGRTHSRTTRSVAVLALGAVAAKALVESSTLVQVSPALAGGPHLESVGLAHVFGGLGGALARFVGDLEVRGLDPTPTGRVPPG